MNPTIVTEQMYDGVITDPSFAANEGEVVYPEPTGKDNQLDRQMVYPIFAMLYEVATSPGNKAGPKAKRIRRIFETLPKINKTQLATGIASVLEYRQSWLQLRTVVTGCTNRQIVRKTKVISHTAMLRFKDVESPSNSILT